MTDIQPGWYPDHAGALRYWDGVRWTEHVAPYPVRTAAAPPAPKRPVWPWVVGGSGLVLLLVIGGGVAVTAQLIAGSMRGPADSVLTFNDSWNSYDCALNNSVTIGELHYEDCDEFESDVHEFLDGTSDYRAVVTDTSITGDDAQVTTVETYIADGAPHSDTYIYELEKHDGVWLIDLIELQD